MSPVVTKSSPTLVPPRRRPRPRRCSSPSSIYRAAKRARLRRIHPGLLPRRQRRHRRRHQRVSPPSERASPAPSSPTSPSPGGSSRASPASPWSSAPATGSGSWRRRSIALGRREPARAERALLPARGPRPAAPGGAPPASPRTS
uniref:Uncharacterized protein n=1 Tax=Ananas comosus var. bracteatus TaxID=296719 RepID=A0A6V7Q1H9_ANACO|nr:unnamed protein product [Ananas comosus var. bracteatus]